MIVVFHNAIGSSHFCCDLFDSKFQGLYYDNRFSLAIVVSSPIVSLPILLKLMFPDPLTSVSFQHLCVSMMYGTRTIKRLTSKTATFRTAAG